MPKISCQRILLHEQDVRAVEASIRAVREGLRQTAAVAAETIDDAVRIIRTTEQHDAGRIAVFRFTDFPTVPVAWQRISPTSAFVCQLRRGRAEMLHLLFMGRIGSVEGVERQIIARVVRRLLVCAGVTGPLSEGVVHHFRFVLHEAEETEEHPDLLGFLGIVPVFCEIVGAD